MRVGHESSVDIFSLQGHQGDVQLKMISCDPEPIGLNKKEKIITKSPSKMGGIGMNLWCGGPRNQKNPKKSKKEKNNLT